MDHDPLELPAERLGFEFNRGMLWSRELLQSCITNHLDAVLVPARSMQEGRGRLDESLNDLGFAVVRRRPPNALEFFVSFPVRARVEEFHRPTAVRRSINGLWNEPTVNSLRWLEHG